MIPVNKCVLGWCILEDTLVLEPYSQKTDEGCNSWREPTLWQAVQVVLVDTFPRWDSEIKESLVGMILTARRW